MSTIELKENAAGILNPGQELRRDQLAKAAGYLEEFLEALPAMPGYTTGRCQKLPGLRIGENGKNLADLLDVLKNEVDAIGINSASGRHMGYIPGGGLWICAVADLLAAATNRYGGIAFSSPGTVAIEDQLITWLCNVVCYPAAAYGNLTSGGSTASLIALKAARDHHQIDSQKVRRSVIYLSAHAHHCLHKAIDYLGLGEAVVRTIELTPQFRLDPAALTRQIAADRQKGLRPFLVIGTAGTTDTGAVDPLEEMAAICRKNGCWFHVDAAYGGFFLLVEELRERFRGIEAADSLVLDPHKTLFMPFGSGAVLVRDKNNLLASNASHAAYMKDAAAVAEISPADTGLELTRHNRGLRMWLPLQLYGTGVFAEALAEKRQLCRYFHQQVGQLGLETGPEPDLSVAIFRCPDDPDNTKTQRLMDRIHRDGRVFLSSTVIAQKLWIRCAIVSHRSHREEVDLAIAMIKEKVDIGGKIG
ncbi:MAG: aminotransferase class V-fold PLP-dependent enzyme [Calditrichaeota bacterium]|nr:aminotransferase class V-fold PLP-dependent enzyme [Calditrichota bacterium]